MKGSTTAYTDEWGIGWRSPKKDGLYYDMYSWPLEKFEAIESDQSAISMARRGRSEPV